MFQGGMIIATEERAKVTTRMVIAAVIVATIFVGISIPMVLLVRGREKPREIPWIKVTGVIDRTVTFQNGDVTLAGTLDLPAGEGPFSDLPR